MPIHTLLPLLKLPRYLLNTTPFSLALIQRSGSKECGFGKTLASKLTSTVDWLIGVCDIELEHIIQYLNEDEENLHHVGSPSVRNVIHRGWQRGGV